MIAGILVSATVSCLTASSSLLAYKVKCQHIEDRQENTKSYLELGVHDLSSPCIRNRHLISGQCSYSGVGVSIHIEVLLEVIICSPVLSVAKRVRAPSVSTPCKSLTSTFFVAIRWAAIDSSKVTVAGKRNYRAKYNVSSTSTVVMDWKAYLQVPRQLEWRWRR